MRRWLRVLGSLTIAVPLLIAIAAVLAWGTIYETRYGTAAVQRFVYHAGWFQALLAFLAINLSIAAASRYPWQRRQVPFVLAHLGIILILVGGILGGRFGIEGQLVIPEGAVERTIETPGNLLIVHLPNPGLEQVIPVRFETQAWVHEPNATFSVSLNGRPMQLTVDRYYPNAVVDEQVLDEGQADNPAVRLTLQDRAQRDTIWLLAHDAERFGTGWGEAHVVFLDLPTDAQVRQVMQVEEAAASPRGVVSLQLPGMDHPRDIPVPEELNRVVPVEGTPYHVTFKDYFSDLAITEQGITNQSSQPNNPAIALIIAGPEGADAYLLFALHPDFQTVHGVVHKIPAQVRYTHASAQRLPPNCIGIIRTPTGALRGLLTGPAAERQVLDPLEVGRSYTHPTLGYTFTVEAYSPRAVLRQQLTNRGNEVKAEAVHVIGREGEQTDEAWVTLRSAAHLHVGEVPITVEYRPARRDLPVTVKLLDFRKIDYPGTQMAAGFESDVELTDPQRGIIVMRTISMNNPLRYRGYSFYQSSYVPGPTEMTVLAVRNDPGTPLVYAGFLIVMGGVVSLFVLRAPATAAAARGPTKRRRPRSRST